MKQYPSFLSRGLWVFLGIRDGTGIGKGIVEALVDSGEFQGILITYNSNREAAESFVQQLQQKDHPNSPPLSLQIELVGGDLSLAQTRDAIFHCFDTHFAHADLCLMVHNAGQYAGITSENAHGIEAPAGGGKKFGDGSLLAELAADGTKTKDHPQQQQDQVQWDYFDFYHQLYAKAYIDLCERSLVRMKQAHARYQEENDTTASTGDDKEKKNNKYRGCIIGISSPGCNHNFKMTAGYDMPGSGKCVMEFANRYYALRAAPFNINVNVIIPGVTLSDAWGKIAESNGSTKESLLQRMKGMVPMEQVAEGRDMGDVVTFLAAQSGGGRFMTGLSLRVDGGLHLT
jgi:NAD(P)-dependent dehydrogenase (short-subunit alcohol dehydrogenase family)